MQRITAHGVPETGLIVTMAIRGLVPVRDSSHGPHPSLLQSPEMRLGGLLSWKGRDLNLDFGLCFKY